jgi:uncharacterized protein (UPF0128 family)
LSYKFVPEDKTANYPARIQEIADEYTRVGLEFILDFDNMDYMKEIGYERWARQKPDKAWMEVLAVYRLKDEYEGKEYLLYKVKKHVPDNNDVDVNCEIWIGKAPIYEVTAQKDDAGNVINKRVTRERMRYTQEWNKTEFMKLMKESRNKRVPLYIAYTSDDYQQNHTGTPIMIKDDKAYAEVSFDTLLGMDERIAQDRISNSLKSQPKTNVA